MIYKKLTYDDPIIDFTPYTNLQLSIANSRKDGKAWLYNNFMQIQYSGIIPIANNFFTSTNLYSVKCDSDYLLFNLIKYNYIEDMDLSIFIENMIRDNFYINFTVDTFYIKEYSTYKKHHVPHNLTIFGCDGDIFHITDFFNFAKSSKGTCSRNELKKAFESVKNFSDKDEIHMMQVNPNIKYEFDNAHMRILTEDYITGFNTHLRITQNRKFAMSYSYGVMVYDKIISELKSGKWNINNIYLGMDLLYKHKIIMLQRLKYMKDHNLISNYEVLSNEYMTLSIEIKSLRNFYLKLRIKNKKEDIDKKRFESISNAKAHDLECAKMFLSSLK